MNPRPWSPFRLSGSFPLFPDSFEVFVEPGTRELVWRFIELDSEVAERGRRLFPGRLAEKNALWREFRNYVRQARDHDNAGRELIGSSGGLLHYYTCLNLAKAELLTTNANDIIDKRIGHGLSYSPTAATSIAGDYVTVQSGVFPLLYQKRTGKGLASGTKLPVRRLLLNVPEIGWEVAAVGLGASTISRAFHASVSDGESVWSVLALTHADHMQDGSVSARLFAEAFEEVSPFTPNVVLGADWREIFALSQRPFIPVEKFFEGRGRYPAHPSAEGTIPNDDYLQASRGTWAQLRPIIDEPTEDSDDATICASLYKAKMVSMPPSLARYVLMYYVSSLVRYRPSHLDPQLRGKEAWLFDAFTNETPIRLLRSALSGITGRLHFFYPRGSLRL